MICKDRQIIFVHIPKCGGSSVEDLLWPEPEQRTMENFWMGFERPMFNKYQTGGLQHLTARLIRQDVGQEVVQTCFKFAGCRDPLKRIVSQFKYMSKRRNLRRFVDLPDEYDFSLYLKKIKKKKHVQWTPQSEFLLDDDGTLLVDQIFFLEDLAKDVLPLAEKMGLSIDRLPVTNTTHSIPEPVISPKLKKQFFKLYRSDYELFAGRYPLPV